GLRDVLGAVRKVTDVSDARAHGVAAAKVSLDGPCLRGTLDDDEALAHRRDTLASGSASARRRYCHLWRRRPGRAGSISRLVRSAGRFGGASPAAATRAPRPSRHRAVSGSPRTTSRTSTHGRWR